MVLDQTWSDQERLVALRYLSRGFSRHDILRHVWAECGREYSDDQLKQMLDNEDIRERQGSFLLLTDVQQQGPKWDLDAIDRVVNDIKGRPPSGSADELMNTRGADEESVLVDETGHDEIEAAQEICIPIRPKTGKGWPRDGPNHQPRGNRGNGGYESQREQQHNQRFEPYSLPERIKSYAPREQSQATLSRASAGVPAIASTQSKTPTGRTRTKSTIPATSPFAPGQPGGSPTSTLNRAASGTNSGGFSAYGGLRPTSSSRNSRQQR